MLQERLEVYEQLRNDKKLLYKHKYKTEKEYKILFPFLKEVSAVALQQANRDLYQTYKNFYLRVKQNKKPGFPKFKNKKIDRLSYREINGNYDQKEHIICIKGNKIKIPKLSYVKFRGLDKNFQGRITSITISKTKSNHYECSILAEQDLIIKERIFDNTIGIDLGLKEFVTTSNGDIYHGIKDKLYEIEKDIKKQQKHLARKQKDSKRFQKCKLKLAKLYEYKTKILDHYQWHLVNKLCSENQTIIIENLNIKGMIKNKKLSHAIHYAGWNKFITKLNQKSVEYNTKIIKINRWFPSSKLCSSCGTLKENLKLSDRMYVCECGLEIDRDLNAAINICNNGINNSSEYGENRHGENVKPIKINYHFNGNFQRSVDSLI